MAEGDDRPGYSFNPGPPPEASAYLRNKGWLPAFSWRDVEPEEHAVAFTVAKATSMEVLRDIREEVQTALDDGLTFRDFQNRLQPRLEARGWWGYGGARDQLDGQEKPALLGTPRRLRTIYDANLRSARAAGQWDRIQRTKQAMPYLTYNLGPSERHRPEHAAKECVTLPVDDPFWLTWFTPNGWGCKCWIRQVSRREAVMLGIDDSPVIATRPWQNARTGEIQQIPVGIDPGWQGNPGSMRRRTMEDVFAGRLRTLSPAARQVAVRDIATSWAMQSRSTAGMPLRVPVAFLPDRIAARLAVRAHVALTPAVARHLFADKSDRAMGDLAALEGLGAANTTFALRTDALNRQSLDVLIAGAARPDDPEIANRRALRVILFLGGPRPTASTLHRTDGRRWRDRVLRKRQIEVLD